MTCCKNSVQSDLYKYAISGSTSMHGARGQLSQQIARIPQNSTDFIVVMIETNNESGVSTAPLSLYQIYCIC